MRPTPTATANGRAITCRIYEFIATTTPCLPAAAAADCSIDRRPESERARAVLFSIGTRLCRTTVSLRACLLSVSASTVWPIGQGRGVRRPAGQARWGSMIAVAIQWRRTYGWRRRQHGLHIWPYAFLLRFVTPWRATRLDADRWMPSVNE